MIQEYSTSARIVGGRLEMRGRQRFEAAMRTMRDGEVVVRVERRHAIRSQEASRYYFGVCLKLLSEHSGHSIDELHEWAKARFIPHHVALCDGNGVIKDELVIGGTTTRLNRLQFYEYVEQIRKFAAEELSVEIPDPNPNYWRAKAELSAAIAAVESEKAQDELMARR